MAVASLVGTFHRSGWDLSITRYREIRDFNRTQIAAESAQLLSEVIRQKLIVHFCKQDVKTKLSVEGVIIRSIGLSLLILLGLGLRRGVLRLPLF